MALRQQEPVTSGVLDEPAAALHQSLSQARQRPVADAPRHARPYRLVADSHHSPAVGLQVRDDESDARKELLDVKLDLRHQLPRRVPARCLVREVFVADHRLVAGPPNEARQQPGNFPFQAVVGRDADGVLHIPLFQRLVDLRLGEGGVGTKHHIPALLLLPLDLRQQQFLETLGAVQVAGPELRRQTVTFAIEYQQQVTAAPSKRSLWALCSCWP
jgi:hypothetical protein